MTISIKSPTSTTGSIQKNGSDVLTIDSSDNVTVVNDLSVSGDLSITGNVPVQNTGPAFSAKVSANYNISNSTVTVLAADVEDFDTNSCYNNTGSTVGGIPAYAFLPNVAGYYQISFSVSHGGISITYTDSRINKNGSLYRYGNILQPSSATFSTFGATGSGIIYMNGTTDYLQIAGYISASSSNNVAGNSYWSGSLVRAA